MKKLVLFFTGIISVIIPVSIHALSGSTSISCSKTTIAPDETVSCTIKGTSSEEVSAVSAKLTSSGNIRISNIKSSSGWLGDGDDGNIDFYTDSNKIGTFSIATFSVTGVSDGSGVINLANTNFTDAEFNDNTVGNKSLTVDVKTAKKLDESSQTNSTTNTNKTTTSDTPKQEENNNATPKKSSDTTLKNISVSNCSINFSKDIREYNLEVSNNIEKIEIEAEASDSKAVVTIPSDLKLKLGENKFEIIVTAEDGTKGSYILNIKRLERVLSNNSKLKLLTIEGYDISFESDTLTYDLEKISTQKLEIKADAEDEKSKVNIHGNDSIGLNDAVVIEVTAEDGTVTNYILYVSNTKNNTVVLIYLISLLVLLIGSVLLNVFFVIKKGKFKY